MSKKVTVTFTEPARPSQALSLAEEWGKLPTELRLHIYRATWEPRAFVLDSKPWGVYLLGAEIWGSFYRPRDWDYQFDLALPPNLHRPPVSLHINRESRHETLRHYVPFPFSGGVAPPGGFAVPRGSVTPRVPTYFNPSVGVLFLAVWPDLQLSFAGPPPSWNRWVGRFFSIMADFKQVCLLGDYDRFETFVAQMSGFEKMESCKTWFPDGALPALEHWGLDAADAAAASKSEAARKGPRVVPSPQMEDGLPADVRMLVRSRLRALLRSRHHHRSNYLELEHCELPAYVIPSFNRELARSRFYENLAARGSTNEPVSLFEFQQPAGGRCRFLA